MQRRIHNKSIPQYPRQGKTRTSGKGFYRIRGGVTFMKNLDPPTPKYFRLKFLVSIFLVFPHFMVREYSKPWILSPRITRAACTCCGSSFQMEIVYIKHKLVLTFKKEMFSKQKVQVVDFQRRAIVLCCARSVEIVDIQNFACRNFFPSINFVAKEKMLEIFFCQAKQRLRWSGSTVKHMW